MPTSQRYSSPSSQSSPSAARRSPAPASPRRQRATHRPERYEVEHRPRRVIRAHETQLPADERVEYSEVQTSPIDSRRVPRASMLKRARRLGIGPWEWLGLGASCVACVFLLREIVGVEGEHQMLRSAVHQKETQLASLEKQKAEEKKKLAYLQSEKGRDQILAERGYLKPGDRILLFPVESQAEDATQ